MTKGKHDQSEQHWIIVGHGMVAMRLLQELSVKAPSNVRLTVISEEFRGGYNRIGLSDVLAGKRDESSLDTVDDHWYREQRVQRVHGRVVHIDRDDHSIVLDDGRELGYSHLILATGSSPRIPDIPGCCLSGVQAFRTREDLQRLNALSDSDRVVVLGGGLLGLEAAAGLAGRGVKVTVLHRGGWLMNRQLDRHAGRWLESRLTAQGIRVITNAEVSSITGDDMADGVQLAQSGEWLDANRVILAIGIVPRSELARQSGLRVDHGIVVDDHLTTSDPAISAVGECVSHRGVSYGLVAPLYEQAQVLASALCGESDSYEGSAVSTRLKVSDVPVFSAGEIEETVGVDRLEWVDHGTKEYKKLLLRDNRLVGVVLYGDVADGPFYHRLIKQMTDVQNVRTQLVFGESFCDLPQPDIENLPQQAAA